MVYDLYTTYPVDNQIIKIDSTAGLKTLYTLLHNFAMLITAFPENTFAYTKYFHILPKDIRSQKVSSTCIGRS